MGKLIEILGQFGLLSLEITPYFLLGTVAGALLKSWLPFSVVDRYLKPGLKSIIAVSVLGGVVPVCSCSMVPLAQAMRDRGATLGAVVAFLLVAPVLSPVTIFLTWGWLGPKFTVARILAAFGGALIVGVTMQRFRGHSAQRQIYGAAACSGTVSCACKDDGGFPRGLRLKIGLLWSNFLVILRDLWAYLLIGIVVSAVLSVMVPPDFIPTLVGSGVKAYVLAAVVGVPIYVCSGEEVPIAKALLDINLQAGATFTFLLSSTGICLPTVLMASRFLGRRNAALYALCWFLLSVCAGLVFSLTR